MRRCALDHARTLLLNNPALNKCEKTSFATELNSKTEMCRKCEGSHFLNQSKYFRKLDNDARKSYVFEAKLYWLCFEPDHFSKSCSCTNACSKQSFKEHQTTHLRLPNLSYRRTTPTEKDRGENSTARAKVSDAFIVSDSSRSGLLSVVPFKIRCSNSSKLITTFALLDSGNTNCFIPKSLIKTLQAKNFSEINVHVSTDTINKFKF